MIVTSLMSATASVAAPAEQTDEIILSHEGVATCLATFVRLDRLACYDSLLGFDESQYSKTNPSKNLVHAEGKLPSSVERLDLEIRATLSASGRLPASDVPAQLVLRDGSGEMPVEALAGLEQGTEPFEALRDVADLRMALRANTQSSARGVLSLRCTSDITEFDILWSDPFDEPIDVVWLYDSDNVSEATAISLPVTFRSGTRVFQFPRGLQSIRLLQGLAIRKETRLLFEAGQDRRLISFDTEKLSQMIRAQARYCSWK